MTDPAAALAGAAIWTALVLYAAGEYGRTRQPAARWARPVWLAGAAAYLTHVAAAFAAYHDWSHAAAAAHVAARTDAVVGVAWSGGIWVNYAFTAVWAGEAIRWGIGPGRGPQRSRAAVWTMRGIFLFMIVNGAVLFVDGWRRGFGLAVAAALIVIWRTGRRTAPSSPPPAAPVPRSG